MAGPPQQAPRQGQLAIQNCRRPRQAEETVPSVRVTRATRETPARIATAAEEPTLVPRRQMRDKRGTVLRINHFPPEDEAVRQMDPQASRAAFAALGNEKAATFGKGGRHPLMHRTETIDYAIVLSGEITMVLDDVDVELSAGDIVVQCGTNHAWSNRSNAPCVVAFVLIDGAFEPELAAKLG